MAVQMDAFSREVMLGVNKSEAYANMAANTADPKEAIHNLRLSIKELHYVIENIAAHLRHTSKPAQPGSKLPRP